MYSRVCRIKTGNCCSSVFFFAGQCNSSKSVITGSGVAESSQVSIIWSKLLNKKSVAPEMLRCLESRI